MTHIFDTNPAGRHFVLSRKVEPTPGVSNIVQNGDFEQGGLLWGLVGTTNPFTLEEDSPISGNVSLRTNKGNAVLLQSKSNQPFSTVIDAGFNVNVNAIRRHRVMPGEIFRFDAWAEDFLNVLVTLGFYEWNHRSELISATNVLTFEDNSLASGVGNLRRRVAFYRVPEGVFEVTPMIFGGFDILVPNGALLDDFKIRKFGSNDNLLLNSDFEDGGKFWGPNDSGAVIEEAAPLLGKKSLKITSFLPGTIGALSVRQIANPDEFVQGDPSLPIPVEAGQIYRVESTGRGQADHIISTKVQPIDEDGLLIGMPAEVVTLHLGTEQTTDFGFYTVPDGVEFVQFSASVAADDDAPRDFFIDELSFHLVESTVTDRLDETKFVEGYWTSPQINRSGDLTDRLIKLILIYSCPEDCTAEIELTRNGGRSWTDPMIVQFTRTEDSTRQKIIGRQVTGHDIRFRLRLNNKILSIFGYRAEMYPAGHMVDVGE